MKKERAEQEKGPREIKFGGEGKAESIKRGFAITTLRNPKDIYDFKPGEIIMADCFDDGEKVPVVVITNETKPLKKFTPAQLALDGFFSPQQAASEMKEWPGYEKTTVNKKMQAITFISKAAYDRIPKPYLRNIKGRDFDNIILHQELRHIFFPTICEHFLNTGGGFEDWPFYLYHFGYISVNENDKMSHYELRGHDMSKLMKDHPEIYRKIVLNPKAPLFKELVLGIFEEN